MLYDSVFGIFIVSIPKRVSEALKLRNTNIEWNGNLFVSIPKRVSEALKL